MISRLRLLACAAALPLCLTLGACDDQQTADTIAQIQKNATQICSFVPTVASISSILSALYPPSQIPVSAGVAVAQQICDAVAPKASAKRGASATTIDGAPVVAGVVVDGHFVYGRHR